MTTVTAPGSSANLGPGFDVLGVAIDRHAWVSDEGSGVRGDELCGPDHLARVAFELAGGRGPIWFGFDLRPSRGMGFSAAARAAGAVLGRLHAGDDLAAARFNAYDIVSELEGHGDNAAPSVFGGIFVIAGDLAHPVAASLPGQLVLWIPEVTTATDESRARLSDSVDRADAVFNLGRVGLLMAALYENDSSLLRRATEDRLHQPTRLAASPDSARAIEAALDAGADAAWLSGSGPTVAVIVDPERVDGVCRALPDSGVALPLAVDVSGSRINTSSATGDR